LAHSFGSLHGQSAYGFWTCDKAAHHGGSTVENVCLAASRKQRERKGKGPTYPLQGQTPSDLISSNWALLLLKFHHLPIAPEVQAFNTWAFRCNSKL
jgi:hypothetical protein